MAKDPNGPDYYKRGSIDVWDFIRDQGLNFHLGNAIKYITRAGHKDSAVQDLQKAIHYLQNELEHAKRKDLPRSASHLPDGSSTRISRCFPSEQFGLLSSAQSTEKFDR